MPSKHNIPKYRNLFLNVQKKKIELYPLSYAVNILSFLRIRPHGHNKNMQKRKKNQNATRMVSYRQIMK